MSEEELSIVEYARRYMVSDMTVRRRIRTGRLKAVLRDGKYYILTNQPPSSQQSIQKPTSTIPSYPVEKFDNFDAHREDFLGGVSSKSEIPTKESSFIAPSSEQRQKPMQIETIYNHLPENLQNPLHGHKSSLIDTRALLDFCSNALEETRHVELFQKQHYETQIEHLEIILEQEKTERRKLEQEIEDFKILIKILEQKINVIKQQTSLEAV